MANRFDWARLNHLQVGRYAEYFMKMEVTLCGFEVYTTEVDDRGIDFIMRRDGLFYEVQVKSARVLNYIFFDKPKFQLRDSLLAAIVLLQQGVAPELYLIPSTAWRTPTPLLVSNDYVGKKSKPDYGINLSKKNLVLLKPYAFDLIESTL